MNNYLLHLLKDVKTLIIPGLGALTVTNESTGEILFMPYLKFDDGTLAQHIATKENMDITDAKVMISKFVRDVTTELDKGGSYDMYQFGSFVKVDGEVAFKMWDASAPKQSATPIEKTTAIEEKQPEAVVETKKEEPKPTPNEEKQVVESVVPEVPKTETPAAVDTKIIEPEKTETPKAEVQPEKVVVTEKTADKPVEKETVKKEKVEKPVKPKKEKVEKPATEKKKRSVFAYVLWGFLFIILGAGTFIAIKFDDLKKDFPILADLAGENDNIAKGSEDVQTLKDDSESIPEDESNLEPVPEDDVEIIEETTAPTTQKETPKVEKPKAEVKKPVSVVKPATPSSSNFDSSKNYHIIAGAFGSEANANRLVEKLKSEGFSEASSSFVNGMHRVSVKGFSTMAEANAELSTIRGKVSSAWVMKM